MNAAIAYIEYLPELHERSDGRKKLEKATEHNTIGALRKYHQRGFCS